MLEPQTLQFLKGLKKNNNKPWFDAHRAQYEAARIDFQNFIQLVIDAFGKTELSIAGQTARSCLFRDWDNIDGPLNKVIEEYQEVLEAMEKFGGGDERTEEELGDLLFAIVNLSRFLKVNPEVALNRTINKFIKRFEFMEEKLGELGKKFEEMTLDEMDELWNQAKIHKIH